MTLGSVGYQVGISGQIHPTGVVQGLRTFEGEGFAVRRPFPTSQLDHLGPFLLLDEMGPSENAPGEAKGAPDHPHRGFETVTYVLDGEMEHKDSVGNKGLIRPGEVQWMTAGSGIVHSELPSAPILANGGRTHGFQLWINLPQKAKMHRPRYQDLTADLLPKVDLDGGRAVIIAGKAFGTKGPADTFLPINYVHVTLEPGASTTLEMDPGDVGFVYSFVGDLALGSERHPLMEGEMAVFGEGGGSVPLEAGESGVDFLFGSAQQLNEPVVRYGPFVMNTREEIITAFEDYQAGRLGSIEPEHT